MGHQLAMRRVFVAFALVLALVATAALAAPREARLAWQIVSGLIVTPSVAQGATFAEPTPDAAALIAAAEGQVGVTHIYDGSYVALNFPGGDIAPSRGVCTDVIIRALREGLSIDLQLAVNRDMSRNFPAYPANWGLSRPDRNIDHRRVPNLARLLERLGAARPISTDPADFQPGDIVATMLPGNLPHILIVTHRASADGQRPLIVHNIGAGTRVEDRLFEYPITGHFRLTPEVLSQLRDLGGI